jgi:hypothetical protein
MIEGSLTDYGQNLNNLIQCCKRNENSSLFIGNAKVTCDDKTTSDDVEDVVDVKIWVDDEGNISNTSTISCNQNIGDGNELTINVIFGENKKK